MIFIDDLKRYLNSVITEGNTDHELEIRFGSFARSFHSNINRNAFNEIIKNSSSDKIFSFIIDSRFKKHDGFIDDDDNDIIKRTTYIGSKINKILENLYYKLMILNKEELDEISKNIQKNKTIKKRNIFLSKNKKSTDDRVNHLRLTSAMENIHSLIDLLNRFVKISNNSKDKARIEFTNNLENIEAKRIKFRCSWIDEDIWRTDATITLSINKKKNQNLFEKTMSFELEIEFDYDAYEKLKKELTIDDMIIGISNLVKTYKNKIDCDYKISIEDLLEKDISNQVVTLEREKINYLINANYSVTEKADGERNFLYIDSVGKVYFINPRTTQRKLLYTNSKLGIKNSIIDGEFLSKENTTTKKTDLYLCFDALFINGEDCRNTDLKQRLKYGKSVISVLSKENIMNIEMRMKKFYFTNIFKTSKKIWKTREKEFEYELDGLIYTPINGTYISSLPNLKWKDEVSIDVRVLYNNRTHFSEFHVKGYPLKRNVNGITKVVNVWRRYHGEDLYTHKIKLYNNSSYIELGLLNQRGILGTYNKFRNIRNMEDIVEFKFDYEKKIWIPLRHREDKENPNARLTVLSALKALEEHITIDEIGEFKPEKSYYSQIVKGKNIDPIGIQYDLVTGKGSTEKRANWRYFQNFVKKKLFTESVLKNRKNEKYLFDCGSGRGGDLLKWLDAGFTNILALDPSSREIYGRNHSEGFSGLIERIESQNFSSSDNGLSYKGNYKGNDVTITVIWGDGTKLLETGEAGYNDHEKEKLLNFFANVKKSKWNGFDTISIMFVIHYMFSTFKRGKNVLDVKRFEIFMKNIIDLLNKKTGIFIGCYLSGDNIMKSIGNSSCYVQKDSENVPFYGIFLKDKKNMVNGEEEDYNKFWKKNPKMIGIKQSIWGWDNEISESMLFRNNLDLLLREHNLFSVKKKTSFEQYYTKYSKKFNKLLIESEKNISFLNNVFMYTSYPSFENQNYKITKKKR